MLAPGDEQDEQVLIRFGDAPGNALTLSQVETLLRLWWQSDREGMSHYVGEAVTGARPRSSRRRGGQ